MPPRPASIKVRALQWLAQREHSRSELRDKLLRLLERPDTSAAEAEADPVAEPAACAAEVDALLQWLEQRGYLSEQRFVDGRVRVRAARYGNLRIRQELQQHGVELAPDAEQELRQTELQRAQAVWRKKFGAPAVDATGRLRQMRFLAGRGFSSEVVRRLVRDAQRLEESSPIDGDGEAPR